MPGGNHRWKLGRCPIPYQSVEMMEKLKLLMSFYTFFRVDFLDSPLISCISHYLANRIESRPKRSIIESSELCQTVK